MSCVFSFVSVQNIHLKFSLFSVCNDVIKKLNKRLFDKTFTQCESAHFEKSVKVFMSAYQQTQELRPLKVKKISIYLYCDIHVCGQKSAHQPISHVTYS